MRDLGRDYVRQINQAYRRTVTMWEGRFKSSLIDSEDYCLACYRYIELNPVRARIVVHPKEMSIFGVGPTHLPVLYKLS
jgi:putative transposase